MAPVPVPVPVAVPAGAVVQPHAAGGQATYVAVKSNGHTAAMATSAASPQQIILPGEEKLL